jgi:hypothetical protein
MSAFGDFDNDDAYDPSPPDPEQVTYHLHRLRTDVDLLAGGELVDWDHLGTTEQASEFAQGASLVDWVTTHAHDPEETARAVHSARQARTAGLPDWDSLSPDDRAIGVALIRLMIEWLEREGGI